MKAINRKLLRDLARSKAQILSIAAVVACGVASVIAMRSTLDSMQRARDEYYASSRFPSVFASLRRAPERVATRIAEIDGVAAVETRVAARFPTMVSRCSARCTSVVGGCLLRAPMRKC